MPCIACHKLFNGLDMHITFARGTTTSAGPANECSTSPAGNGPSCWMASSTFPYARTQCTCNTEDGM